MSTEKLKPPKTLGTMGRFLWLALINDLPDELEFDSRDLSILEAACAQQDHIADMARSVEKDGAIIAGLHGPKVHPAVSELRQSRTAVARLLGQLDLEMPNGAVTPKTRAARKAARERWSDHDGRTRRMPT